MVSHDRDTPAERYALSARVLHWLMALGFLFMWACGYTMTTLVAEDSPLEEFLFGLHISLGVTLLFLLVLRLALRVLSPPPPLPPGLAEWEKTASHLGHWGLYLLPAAVIAVGWAETDFGGHGVKWFGLPMPKVLPTRDRLFGLELESLTASLHMWLAYVLLVLALVHVAAVAKHRWIDGHDVLQRMTFGRRR